MKKLAHIGVRVTVATKARLQREASRRERSVSWLINLYIQRGMRQARKRGRGE